MFGVLSKYKVGFWATLCLLTALVALAGHYEGLPALAGFGRGLRPMPPGSAWITSVLCLGLFLARGGRRRLWVRSLMAALGLVLVAILLRTPSSALLARVGYLAACLGLGVAAGHRSASWKQRQVAALAALVPLVAGSLLLFGYAAGMPLLYEATVSATPLPTSLTLFLLGHALLALAGNDTFPLSLFHLDRVELASTAGPWLKRMPLLSFMVLASLGAMAGALWMRGQARAHLRAARAQLAAVADLKASTLDHWMEERIGDAEVVRGGGLLQEALALRLQKGSGPGDGPVRSWMASMRALCGYQCVALCDPSGREIIGDGTFRPAPASLQKALDQGRVVLEDLHRDPDGGAWRFGFWVPVMDAGGTPAGAVNLAMEADHYFGSFLPDWPTLGPRGETFLVEPGRGLLGSVPSDALGAYLEAASRRSRLDFVTGGESLRTRAFGAVRPLRWAPWTLAVRIGEADLVEQLRPRFWGTAMATLGSVLLLAMATGFLVRRQGGIRIREMLAMERERKALAERSKVLMREANDIILLLDPEGRILEANERAQASYGYTLEELLGRTGGDLRAPEAAADFQAKWEWLKAQGSGVWETWHRRKDGTVFPVEISSRVVTQGGGTYVLSFLRDISERHAQAQEIRHLTQLYAALGQVGQAVVWTRDREGLFQRVCSVLVEFGRMGTAWIGVVDGATGDVTLAGASGREAALGRFAREGGRDPLEGVIREGRPCILDDASESAAAFPIAQAGVVTHILGVVATVPGFFGPGEVELLKETALDLAFALDKLDEQARRARAEEDLRTAEEFAENLIQTANAIVVCLDETGRVVMVNEAATEITGFTREELLGRDWFQTLVPRERYPEVWGVFGTLLEGGVPRHFENPIRAKDGTEKYISWQNSEVRRGGRIRGTISFGIEITQQRLAAEEQKRLEAQLAQSQKMESLGSLAGGVAHDLNNVLGAILSLASAHREDPGLAPALSRSLDTIVTACLRGRGVTKSLLYFARKGLEEERPLDLNALVADITQLLAHTTLKRVAPVMALEEGLPSVMGDAGALSHAIMNLCVNAVDAMERGGTLTLRTRREPGGGVSLAVEDTGSGMPPEVLRKAMEPFFTTKPMGKGTGLGLSMVFGTMKAHGGALDLRSAPGEGTSATLHFPASRVLEAPSEGIQAVPAAPGARPLSILLVDDDELIREAVGPMLEVLGHRVSLAPGGTEALAMLEGGLDPDLVILDMNMPGLTGAETLPRILALRPAQRVVMASGYSDQDVARLVEGRPGVRSLRKPYSLAEFKALLDAW
ncbi:PAS domain S-box protein [Mesoterricola silvestris]|uniref:histidine kinase n=1 Tax=Mesoterricola silvestris TaxID=2927979 RepID=A0AA48GIX3_9BACT|nr:PAS domain S-box protein [Mesoterricola silvestris]BDU73811.1 hypothetical protein METEAL_29850 [Mesoterricola silvestris]